MRVFEALLLGLVQGVSEFLPISSSGHLVLLQHLLGWTEADLNLVFDTTLHMGTLVAVIAVFWRDIWTLLQAWWAGLRTRRPLATPESRLAWWIILGTIPAVVAGVLLQDPLTRLFAAPRPVGFFLLLTALLLLLAELLGRRRRDLTQMTWLDGLLIGVAQAAAILPGLSRSGATMSTGMYRDQTRESAARFSFLLSIPIIAGTGVEQLLKLAVNGGSSGGALPLLVGFVAALVMGYASIRLLLSYLRKWTLYPFVAYCVVMGGLAIIFFK